MTKLVDGVSLFLQKNNIRNKTVLMALSGGVDSSVLFYILNGLKEEFNLDLKVIHLNHNWRGRDSFLDEEFAKDTAKKAGCGFYSEVLDDFVKKTEVCAREARYAFFERALKKFDSEICFLAHNKDDNVETLIYRMIKGTGIRGLCSIPAVRAPYYRPLLEFSRWEIEEFASQNGIKFRVDKSNSDKKYKRNFIRHEILPLMENINKNAKDALYSLINLACENNSILDEYIKSKEKEVFLGGTIILDKFLLLSDELQREILSLYFKGILKNRDYKTILKIQKFISENDKKEGATLSVGKDLFLKIEKNKAFLHTPKDVPFKKGARGRKGEAVDVLGEGVFKIGDCTVVIEKTRLQERAGACDFREVIKNKPVGVEYVFLKEPLNYKLRFREEGDLFSPLCAKGASVRGGAVCGGHETSDGSQGLPGSGEHKVSGGKLKTYFIKKKIPVHLRDEIPLLTDGKRVLVIIGKAISNDVKLDFEKEKVQCGGLFGVYKISLRNKNG